MKTFPYLRNQSGFTIIDSLMAAAVISIGALGISAQIIAQKKELKKLSEKGDSAVVMDVVMEWISSSPGLFPALPKTEGGKSLVYRGCFDRRGIPVGESTVTGRNWDVRAAFFVVEEPTLVGESKVMRRDEVQWACQSTGLFEVSVKIEPYKPSAAVFELSRYTVSVQGLRVTTESKADPKKADSDSDMVKVQYSLLKKSATPVL